MTATVQPIRPNTRVLLPPLDPFGLARSEAFLGGVWRDEYGRDLLDAIGAEIGDEPARVLWNRAALLVEQIYGPPGSAVLPRDGGVA